MFPTTPFPATMDFNSPYYWDPATYSLVPNPFFTTPYYGAPQWNVAPFHPPTINYSLSMATNGYHAHPYPTLNQASYNNYVNFFTPNYTPFYDPAQFPGMMPMPPPPMPTPAPNTLALPAPPAPLPMPTAPTTLAPPATLPIPAVPSPPTVPAVQVKKEPTPMVKSIKVKEEPVEDTPHTCSNCKTTNASEWKNAISKDNILCKNCFDYRRTHKENRPVMKTHVKKEMKSIKSE